MKDIIFDDFQNSVDDCFLRHRSILDITSKLQESHARVNRSIAKAITDCGCICINSTCNSKDFANTDSNNIDTQILNKYLETHLQGTLCESCNEIIQKQIGNHMFYLTSLCNLLGLNLYDILLKENDSLNTLGKYTLK